MGEVLTEPVSALRVKLPLTLISQLGVAARYTGIQSSPINLKVLVPWYLCTVNSISHACNLRDFKVR